MTASKTKSVQRLSFKKLVTSIEKSNKTFEKATQATRIMMVAQDVLNLLKLGRIKAKHGFYVMFPDHDIETSYDCQVSDLLKMPNFPACQVCAIGAGMVASTLRLNNVQALSFEPSYTAYYDTSGYASDTSVGMSNRALEVFSSNLLWHMEQAFENSYYGYERVRAGAPRLRAIYKNLVDNKGKKFTWYRLKNEIIWSCEYSCKD